MDGISIDLISEEMLGRMGRYEKVRFILDNVKNGKILVLEKGLEPREEAELIERTMNEIDQDKFIGIELESYESRGSIWERIMRKKRTRMEVIGPADMLKTVYKDGNVIKALILTRGEVLE
ncbi:MAG: DUF2073 domain-containing protein [Candidatus Thermoplasmatota archaeon]|nr:DUF2073 domain-containing protein [Candidatus Thermoplasmatota archaeon]